MSASNRFDEATFERLLSVHGAKLERWPKGLAESARALIEGSTAARASWEAAQRLDTWLSAAPVVEPSPDLMARIASLPARYPQSGGFVWWPFGKSLAPLLAWSAAAALGILVGTTGAPELDLWDEAPTDEVAETERAPSADEWSDLSELVMGADWALEDE
jgi:hypothetical protein